MKNSIINKLKQHVHGKEKEYSMIITCMFMIT